ncbi:MAG: hypothetical protein M3Z24_13930 [Chloroflexota bacterium]|nr:hypothetical protein [Chloroflexota bacterium]
MFPMNDYAMIQKHQEDLLQQAKNEQLVQALKRSQQKNWMFHHRWASWFGTRLVKWGKKLESLGTVERKQHIPALPTFPTHHL